MKDYEQLRAIAAAVAFPDIKGKRHGTVWAPVTRATLPARDVTDDRRWMSEANCRGMSPDLFILAKGASTPEVDAAKAVCAGCVVRTECLEYAITHREKIGIWGGTSPNERRRIIRERGLPESVPVPINHGTPGGAITERRRGLPTCTLCREAEAAYIRRRRAERAATKEAQ